MTSERPGKSTRSKARSKARPEEAYVWIWLPDALQPVVAGRIARDGDIYFFNYGQSYLARREALPLYLPELPLTRGAIAPEPPLEMANCLRDSAPDAWGRRVIINRLTGLKGEEAHAVEFDELTFLLNSGSDRIGALDFQESATRFRPREAANASLEELQEAAARVERGEPILRELERALFHGSSIGGARPKALIEDGDRKFVAKFSATNDTYSVVKAEFIAMRLAEHAHLSVAPVTITRAAGKDVILIERFDRVPTQAGWTRRVMVSALTMLGLHEMSARHARYTDLADVVRARFTDSRASLTELFARMVFNVLVGNTDDHARNHAAFWNGRNLTLTPAYDICPQVRNGREANQALVIHAEDRRSRLETCRAAAAQFLLSAVEAHHIIEGQVAAIQSRWNDICEEAELSRVDRAFLWRRQFLNDYAFEGYEGGRLPEP